MHAKQEAALNASSIASSREECAAILQKATDVSMRARHGGRGCLGDQRAANAISRACALAGLRVFIFICSVDMYAKEDTSQHVTQHTLWYWNTMLWRCKIVVESSVTAADTLAIASCKSSLRSVCRST